MYLKIHPFGRPEHGLKHSEDEVGPPEERTEHDFDKYPEGESDPIELLDHGSDEHLEDGVEHQEHNLDHNLDKPLEGGAEPKQGVELENLGTFSLYLQQKDFSEA